MSEQVFLFCYHKVGTHLLQAIFSKISRNMGRRYSEKFGMVRQLPPDADVILFAHSLVDFALPPHRGLRLVRDPRDVWVSGYFYHRRCSEPWCVNEDFSTAEPIDFPRVPLSQQHRPEAWKREYIEGLGGRSYQRNLLDLDLDTGLWFELDRYAGWTTRAMSEWRESGDTMSVSIERFAFDFDRTMEAILDHLGFAGKDYAIAMDIAKREDVNRMNDDELRRRLYISSRTNSKWKQTLTQAHTEEFDKRYGDLTASLGY